MVSKRHDVLDGPSVFPRASPQDEKGSGSASVQKSGDHKGSHDTKRILEVAERLARRGGYFCFDIHDVAEETGLTEASVQSHFKNMEELGAALVNEYTSNFIRVLGNPDDPEPIGRLVKLWSDAAKVDDQMCLCSLYGAEIAALPKSVADATEGFYEAVSRWIVSALRCQHNAEHGEAILASLCGALLTVKSMKRPDIFESIAWQLIHPVTEKCRSTPSD